MKDYVVQHPIINSIKFAIAAITLLVAMSWNSLAALAQDTPTVQPISPSQNAQYAGRMDIKFRVNGLGAGQYEPFWAVGNGQWNRMAFDVNDSSMAVQTIDISDWNWNSDSKYTLRFIALQKSNWQPIEASVTITKGTPVAAPVPIVQPTVPEPAQPTTDQSALVVPAQSTATRLYVDPANDVARRALAYSSVRPEYAAGFKKLAATPMANWYGNWNAEVKRDANEYVSKAAAANQMPVLVAYNIPQRDCGSYSAGGVSDKTAYVTWITSLADGIAKRNAIVVFEPDALAGLDCLDTYSKSQRIEAISQAVTILKTRTNAKVYIDAGHAHWHSAHVVAERLQQANIAAADGFSLNVSNFISTSETVTYGNQITQLTGGKHYVIDTSRNGNGSNNEWCNPSGRAFGAEPTLATNTSNADAYLWIKNPGASDGACGRVIEGTSAPGAGIFWPQATIEYLWNSNYARP